MPSHWTNDDQLELGEDDAAIALRRAWERTLRAISSKVSKSSFENFFRDSQPLSFDGNCVVVGTPTRFAKEWLDKKYSDTLKSQLGINLGQPQLEIRFVISTGPVKTPPLGDSAAVQSEPIEILEPPRKAKAAKAPDKPAVRPLPPGLSLPLNDRFTFETFITGKSNRLAAGGAEAVANQPGEMYNPLFLYGQPGLGKTHLMHAIGHRILQNHPNARIAYVSGESFANSYISALREKRSDDMRAIYRNVDVWLVDDVQTLAGKEHTKEEFFHTFNTLHQMKKQIVLSSDRSPRELRMMDERLRQRFECGLIADVAPPDLEMRIAILQQKAIQDGQKISDDVLHYMATLIQSNIRALEGALIKLMAYSSIHKVEVTKQLASDVLGSYYVERRPLVAHESRMRTPESNNGHISGLQAMPIPPQVARISDALGFGGGAEFEHIVATVADHFGVDPQLLAGESSAATARRRDVAEPRQIAIYLARERTRTSVTELARLFGGVSHSAVSHAHTKMVKLLQDTPQKMAVIAEITSRL